MWIRECLNVILFQMKTAYDMRISDWSSDVCSSDLRLPHAATLVSRRGEIAHLSCIGEARPGEALKEDAIFRIASMTKPITSIALMMLVEEGKVALSDPLVKYCHEFRDRSEERSVGKEGVRTGRSRGAPVH